MKKVRLDQLVFERGFTESRERAKTTVMSGLVYVNGEANVTAFVELNGDERALGNGCLC